MALKCKVAFTFQKYRWNLYGGLDNEQLKRRKLLFPAGEIVFQTICGRANDIEIKILILAPLFVNPKATAWLLFPPFGFEFALCNSFVSLGA